MVRLSVLMCGCHQGYYWLCGRQYNARLALGLFGFLMDATWSIISRNFIPRTRSKSDCPGTNSSECPMLIKFYTIVDRLKVQWLSQEWRVIVHVTWRLISLPPSGKDFLIIQISTTIAIWWNHGATAMKLCKELNNLRLDTLARSGDLGQQLGEHVPWSQISSSAYDLDAPFWKFDMCRLNVGFFWRQWTLLCGISWERTLH